MRYLFFVVIICCGFTGCKKGNGNSAPVIKFKSISENYFTNITVDKQPLPIITIQVSDDDGDLGFKDGRDTSYIFIKNISLAPFKIDSFKFPASLSLLPNSAFSSFIDVDIDLSKNSTNGSSLLYPSNRNNPKKDTTYFEVYVKDFAKNKSNVIKTDKPLLLITP